MFFEFHCSLQVSQMSIDLIYNHDYLSFFLILLLHAIYLHFTRIQSGASVDHITIIRRIKRAGHRRLNTKKHPASRVPY